MILSKPGLQIGSPIKTCPSRAGYPWRRAEDSLTPYDLYAHITSQKVKIPIGTNSKLVNPFLLSMLHIIRPCLHRTIHVPLF